MPTDERNNIQKLENQTGIWIDELSKLSGDDPSTEKIMKNIDTSFKITDAYEKREQSRLNDNARNDIEEQKVIVEAEKARNERRRVRGDHATKILYAVAGIAAGWMSYNFDQVKIPIKSFSNLKDKFIEKVSR